MAAWNKEGALTVGQLRRMLEGVPDDAVVGTSALDVNGYLTKATDALYHEGQRVLVLDPGRRGETLCDEEVSDDELRKLG